MCINRPVPGELRPLEVGNRWDYEILRKREVEKVRRFEVVGHLRSANLPRGEGWIVDSYLLRSPEKRVSRIWSKSDAGLVYSGDIHGLDTTFHSFLTYPFPAEVGEISRYTLPDSTDENGNVYDLHGRIWQVLSTDYLTNSPVGRYSTIVYKMRKYSLSDFGLGPMYEHFAPGIGMIAYDLDYLSVDGADQ